MLCRFTVFWRKLTFSLSMQLEVSMQIPFHKTCPGHWISRRALNSHHTDFCQRAGAPFCHPSRVSWEVALLLVGWRHVYSRAGLGALPFIAKFFAPLKAQSLCVEGLDSINHLWLSTTTCQMWEYCLRWWAHVRTWYRKTCWPKSGERPIVRPLFACIKLRTLTPGQSVAIS